MAELFVYCKERENRIASVSSMSISVFFDQISNKMQHIIRNKENIHLQQHTFIMSYLHSWFVVSQLMICQPQMAVGKYSTILTTNTFLYVEVYWYNFQSIFYFYFHTKNIHTSKVQSLLQATCTKIQNMQHTKLEKSLKKRNDYVYFRYRVPS